MTDDQVIEAGRELKEMRDSNPGFKRLKAEIAELMGDWHHKIMAYKGAGAAEVALPYFLYRYQALEELTGWLDDEIKKGERALIEQLEAKKEPAKA